jgi:RNA-directed DNA polymerase
MAKKTKTLIIADHKAMAGFVGAIRRNAKDANYIVSATESELNIYDADAGFSKSGDPIAIYRYECPEIADFFRQVLLIAEDYSDACDAFVSVNKSNNHQFMMNETVMDIILTAKKLQHDGKPLTRHFQIPKHDGTMRDITAPDDELKEALRRQNSIYQAAYDHVNESFQVAYKRGKNIKSGAAPHAKNKYNFYIDLHDFFPSCKRDYVDAKVSFLFANTLNSNYVKKEYLDVILLNDALYVGSPISGTLANAIIAAPVKYMKNICAKFGIEFTVYADDMTFSSPKRLKKEFVIDIFNRAFVVYGMDSDFTLSEHKCHGASTQRRCVTGVVINHEGKMTCHRYIYNDIRQGLHHLEKGDLSEYNHDKLAGRIAFMRMVDDSGKLARLLERYKGTVRKYHLASDRVMDEMGVK